MTKKHRHPYLIMQDKIEDLKRQEFKLMERRTHLQVKLNSFLDECDECYGDGKKMQTDEIGYVGSFICSNCNGAGYFYPKDLEKEIEIDNLKKQLHRKAG